MEDLRARLAEHFDRLRPQVIRPAKGFLKHDYLVPGGYYQEQWDWDGYFIGLHLARRGEPAHLTNWALNFLEAADEDGFVPGCISPDGPAKGHRAFPMKPFLAQGCDRAASALGDYSWLGPHFDALVKVVTRRERTNFDPRYGLFYWDNAMQSGADNNPALSNDPSEEGLYLACDLNTFQAREYVALSHMATNLRMRGTPWAGKAKALAAAIRTHLWFGEEHTFWNVRRDTGEPSRRVSYSNFVPLSSRPMPPSVTAQTISRYLLSDAHLRSPFGLRTLSRQDPDYSNEPIIHPYSNWRGPVWPIANYHYFRALWVNGFVDEARELAEMVARLLLADIERTGSMHENYDAETGLGLMPEGGDFVGWNLLVEDMLTLAGRIEIELRSAGATPEDW